MVPLAYRRACWPGPKMSGIGMIPDILAVAVGVFVAGIISGATGQAFPLIAGPIFLLEYPAAEAVALTALCSLTGQVFSALLLRRLVAYQFRGFLIAAGVVGVPLGTTLLTDCSPHLVRTTLGTLILASATWALIQPITRNPRRSSCASEALVGLCGGLTGGLAGASSVVPAIWCAVRGLDKESQRAVIQPYIMAVQLASLAALWYRGTLRADFFHQYVVCLVPLLCGIGVGVEVFHLMSSKSATQAVLSLAAASGIALLFLA